MASVAFGLAILRPRLMLARMMLILLSVADAHAELLPVMMVRHHGSRQHDHADQQKKVCGKSAATFHHSRVWCKVTENLCLSNEFRKFLDEMKGKNTLKSENNVLVIVIPPCHGRNNAPRVNRNIKHTTLIIGNTMLDRATLLCLPATKLLNYSVWQMILLFPRHAPHVRTLCIMIIQAVCT